MMKSTLSVGLLATLLAGVSIASQESTRAMPDVRLMTVDPGHFHAALVQREMYPGVAPRVDIYAAVGPDLTEHLNRIVAFNRRSEQPTTWALDVHASPDFFRVGILGPGRAAHSQEEHQARSSEPVGLWNLFDHVPSPFRN